MASLSGSFHLLYLFDVAEEIRIDELRKILRIEKPEREPGFGHLAPSYVRFEHPPIEEQVAAVRTESGDLFPARMRYFDYGVAVLELEASFEGEDWPGVIALAGRWIGAPEMECLAEARIASGLEQVAGALHKPFSRRLFEDYCVVELREVLEDGAPADAARLVERYGAEIAQIVRGESQALSATERGEVLASSISYSPGDLMVAGWTAAVIYDAQPESAAAMRQLLEYANTQLLEFRHYDEVLSGVLKELYQLMERRPGVLRRWHMIRQAQKLNAIRLEVMELSERADTAIKFLSDVFYARAFKMAAARIGAPDYRLLVDEKVKAAGELYRFLMEEFHHARAFVLEFLVVVILIIDLIYLFRGKT
ncbi:MAG: hypothetical protein JNK48_06240 [Bryobacterales bacterium]|nr:hypothetical protein [Bryobacterales bacterium]